MNNDTLADIVKSGLEESSAHLAKGSYALLGVALVK